MILEYLPIKEILIDNILIEFGDDRELVRSKLAGDYKEDDNDIPIDDLNVVHQRRDIYKNFSSKDDLFYLSYDERNRLSEVEVHFCSKIKVLDVLFDFHTSVSSIASELEKYTNITKNEEGEFFFKDLKLNIMDKFRMGGEGNTLGYFYCASDTSHLE